jgi:[protein-PII] uridylyltransferase
MEPRAGSGAALAEPVARLLEELAALDRAYSRGHHGLWSGRRRAGLVDAALVELWGRAAAPPGSALLALGGYGRGVLAPRSDIDLLVAHDGAAPEEIASLAERLLYPLWDAGLAVGHAVRTPEESVALARENLAALTAMLDARPLAGEPGLDPRSDALAVARQDVRAFAGRLHAAGDDRRARFGSTAHLLEPDLKEGAGGLRDVASVRWLEAALGRPLEELGLLRARERDALDAAEDFLTRVRSALQLETDKRSDRLILDHQPSIARAAGFEDEPRLAAVDGLMRAVFEHARQVEHVSRSVFERFLADEPAATPPTPPASAAAILALVAEAAEAGRQPTAAALDAIEAAALPDEVAWDEEILEAFLRIVRTGAEGAHALEVLDRIGVLERFVPAWRDVRCRPQRDPYHRFTVDAHLTTALAAMARLLSEEGGADPVAAEAVRAVEDPDALLLGALFHDIGKVGEGGHVEAGTRVVSETFDRMGLRGHTRELAGFMVAEHLLLPDTATRRDLGDADLVLGVAARVGSPERLAALYLLAVADAEATGAAAWTPWRSTLVRELVAKVQRAFERGEMGDEQASVLAERVARVRDLLASEPEADVDRFLRRMPPTYFLTLHPAQIASHYGTIAPDLGANEVRSLARDGHRPGTYEVLVVAADRPGLLSWIAGSLSLAGLSILSAQVFTTDDGAAVDLFEVEGAYEPEVGESRWREFRSTLRKAIEGRISLDRRMEEKRRHYPPPKADVPVTVAVDNDASDFFTVIEVGAADRIGLLYDITRAMSELALDVHLAKVATYEGRVIDAFYVRDTLGRKVEEPDAIETIGPAIRERLGAA